MPLAIFLQPKIFSVALQGTDFELDYVFCFTYFLSGFLFRVRGRIEVGVGGGFRVRVRVRASVGG